MAEEKRATDRIYDHKASKKARGEEPKKKAASASSDGEGGDAKQVASETLEEIRARHRREQEESHKGYTKALDDMVKRHADEIDVAIGKHGTHIEAGSGVTAEEA